jgi:hypothetical protein
MGKDEVGLSKKKAHERTPSPIKQRKGMDKVNVGSLIKTPTTPQKQKRKEKVLEPIVEFDEHVDFHSLKLNGDSLIAPLGVPRQKGGKQALESFVVNEYLEKHEEEIPKVEKSSKKFLALVDGFRVFMVQQREATTQNQEIAKLMNFIVEGLGAIDSAPSGGFAKATVKVKLSDSFVRKETKVDVYMETQHLKTEKEHIHFTQTLLKEHVWE